MRYIVLTIFLLLFFNCKKNDTKVTNSELEKEQLETVNSDETVENSDSKKELPDKMVEDWTMADDYFQVYTFSDNVMGLTIELSYTHTVQNAFVDSVFIHTAQTDSLNYVISQKVNSCIPIETKGQLAFYRNLTLERKLLSGIDRTFFVYCTNGMIQREIKDVVFSLNECWSNIVVFRFDPIDLKKYGRPLFCSKANLNLTFANKPAIDNKIKAFRTLQQYDYADSIKSVSFAYRDSLYFAYHDDFSWNREGDIKNLYPGREVYVLDKDKRLYMKWALSLDLFGIPCD